MRFHSLFCLLRGLFFACVYLLSALLLAYAEPICVGAMLMMKGYFCSKFMVSLAIISSSSPDFVTQKCPFCNWLINNILYLCIPLFWGTQKVF